jgi:hypothetical protein
MPESFEVLDHGVILFKLVLVTVRPRLRDLELGMK